MFLILSQFKQTSVNRVTCRINVKMFAFLLILLFLNMKRHTVAKTAKIVDEVELPSSEYLLPLIMIESEGKFYAPTHIEKEPKIKKHPSGLLGNTDFQKENYPGNPVYFCPAKSRYKKRIQYKNNQNDGPYFNENCLFEKKFRSSNELKCSKIATPLILKIEGTKCGPQKEGIIFEFAYQLCLPLSEKEKQKLDFNSLFTAQSHKELPCREFQYFKLYTFCVDQTSNGSNTTIYTEHEVISPTLFAYDEMKYDYMKEFEMATDGHGHFESEIFENINDAFMKEAKTSKNKMKQTPQKMVPPEHLFFALWKKPTYHYVNVKPMNEKLAPLWRHINDLILRSTTSMIAHTHLIYTGAFKFPENEKEMIQFSVQGQILIPDIWIIFVIQYPKNDASSTPAKGIAFIMSNYIGQKDTEQKIDKYCEKNSCEKSLEDEFKRRKGFIRCCPPSLGIQSFFGFELNFPKVLYFRDLNFEDDLDFSKFDFDNPIP